MMWFLGLVVVLATTIFLLTKHRDKVVLWEFAGLWVVSILVVSLGQCSAESFQTHDTEYWGGWVVNANYEERWNEEVPCSHTKYCTRTDSNGRIESYSCGTEHAYDVDNHPPKWYVYTSNKETLMISQSQYQQLVAKFGTGETFVDMHRSYHSIDGNKYVATWSGIDQTLESAFTSHSYENRVQAAESVYSFQDVSNEDKKMYGLWEYPELQGYYMPALLGAWGPGASEANQRLVKFNAKFGKSKQVRVWVVVFKNQPREAGFKQEALWKRGNKNEFVITVGLNDRGEIQWCYPFSWTEVEILKVEARNLFEDRKGEVVDYAQVTDWIEKAIPEKWVRKQFVDFSYLSVTPSGWAIFFVILILILVNFLYGYWVVMNEFEEGGSRYRRRYDPWSRY
jgi:hypothetical protein